MKITKNCVLTMLLVMVLTIGVMPTSVNAARLGKVKSVSTKTQYKTYKGITSALDMKYHKIKYKYGIKASWKKVKNASGYEIYAYGTGSKKWRLVKDTKKNSYTFTNLLKKDQFKIKIRAYKKVDGQKIYGDWSKSKKVKATEWLTKKSKGGHKKEIYFDRYAAEQAFELQNKYRQAKGIKPLVWSEALYEICKARCKEIQVDYSHDKFIDTSERILTEKYGLTQLDYEYEDEDGGIDCVPYAGGENIAMNMNTYKEVMEAWKASSGHYRNLLKDKFVGGAIACYVKDGRTYWVAVFGGADLDKIIKENKK